MTHPEFTTEERLRACLEHDNIRAPRAQAIADMLVAKGFQVTVEPWTTSTDRKIPNTRLRHPGLGREGKRIDVYPSGVQPHRANRLLRWETSAHYLTTNRDFAAKVVELLDWDLKKFS